MTIKKRTALWIAAMTLVVGFAANSARAACNDRPGTPSEVFATPQAATDINLRWISTYFPSTWDPAFTVEPGSLLNSKADPSYYDISVRKGTPDGEDVGLDRTGDGPYYAADNSYDRDLETNFTVEPSTTYCFRVRARTEAGTEGCVSQEFTAWTCATTPDDGSAAIAAFCGAYADQAVAEARESQQLGCGNEGPRWSTEVPGHRDWCVGLGADHTLPDSEKKARAQGLSECRARIALRGQSVPKPLGSDDLKKMDVPPDGVGQPHGWTPPPGSDIFKKK